MQVQDDLMYAAMHDDMVGLMKSLADGAGPNAMRDMPGEPGDGPSTCSVAVRAMHVLRIG